MEVSVYYVKEKPLFKRVVMCPDVFDIDSFVLSMKGIFGEKVVIEILIT